MIATWISLILAAAASSASAAYTTYTKPGCKAPVAAGCQAGKAVYLKPGVCVATCPLGKCAAGFTNKYVAKTYTKPAYITACTACSTAALPGCRAYAFTTLNSCNKLCKKGMCGLNFYPVSPAATYTACKACPTATLVGCSKPIRTVAGSCTVRCATTGCNAGYTYSNGICLPCNPLPGNCTTFDYQPTAATRLCTDLTCAAGGCNPGFQNVNPIDTGAGSDCIPL